jgi:hypothetical protein
MNKRFLATAAAVFMLCGAAKATEYEFTFTDTISSANTPGIDVGDTFTLHMFADNGGSTAVSQTWNLDDLLGFTIQAGSYSASYSAVFPFPTTDNFVTDASGMMSSVAFQGTSGASHNTDNFGSWIGDSVFTNAEFCDFDGHCNNISADGFDNASKWTVAAAGTIPEPSTWAMMLLGFAGLGFAGYRRATIS